MRWMVCQRSGVIGVAFADFLFKPGTCEIPIAFDGAGGDVEGVGGFGDGESTEGAKFDDATHARIDVGKLVEFFVERENVEGLFRSRKEIALDQHSVSVAASFDGIAFLGVVDEDASYDGGCSGEELRAVPIDGGIGIGEAEIGFVDEGGGLEGVVVSFAGHVSGGEGFQLVVDGFDGVWIGIGEFLCHGG